MSGKVFLRRPVWIAWYPLRGHRCNLRFVRNCRRVRVLGRGRWHAWVGLGPFYAGFGPGIPEP
jgi:hypothetical protein